MKKIEIDDELYQYIASRTLSIGESASDILRRLLRLPASPQPFVLVQEQMENTASAKSKSRSVDLTEKTVKSVEAVLKSPKFVDETKGVKRFLLILTALYQANPKAFASATENVQGSERTYFAKDEATILAHGSSVKAKQIPESPFWVITNNNTARKGIILVALMNSMQLPNDLVERIHRLFTH